MSNSLGLRRLLALVLLLTSGSLSMSALWAQEDRTAASSADSATSVDEPTPGGPLISADEVPPWEPPPVNEQLAEITPDRWSSEERDWARRRLRATIIVEIDTNAAELAARQPAFASALPDELRRVCGIGFDADVLWSGRWKLPAVLFQNSAQSSADSTLPSGTECAFRYERSLAGCDKLFCARLTSGLGNWEWSVREWDVLLEDWSAPRRKSLLDADRALSDLAVLVQQVLRPLLLLKPAPSGSLLGIAWGGQATSLSVGPQVGQHLRVMTVYRDKAGAIQARRPIPWTYLTIEATDGVLCRGLPQTAFRGALGTVGRRSVLVGVPVAALYPQTSFAMSTRQTQLPVSAARVVVSDPLPPDSAAEDAANSDVTPVAPAEYRADRAGVCRLPNLTGDVQILEIRRGEAVLGRVPYLIGESPDVRLELGDDAPRLFVEAELSLLKDRLFRETARRQVAMAQARRLAKAGRWSEVDPLLASLDATATATRLQRELTSVEVIAVDECRQLRDRASENRVKVLTNVVRKLIDRYLNPDEERKLREELTEERQVTT